MTMEYLERELRLTGNNRDNKLADFVSRMLKARGTDIPLPKIPQSSISKEPASLEVKLFSDKSREALTREGYVFYSLTGQSIKSLQESGKTLGIELFLSDYPFEGFASRHSEVAINPNQFFLPESNNKNRRDQEELTERYSTELERKIGGVMAIIGGAADYVELAFSHLERTGERLFWEKNQLKFARTRQLPPHEGWPCAGVGCFSENFFVLNVDYWDLGHERPNIFAAPLLIPASST